MIAQSLAVVEAFLKYVRRVCYFENADQFLTTRSVVILKNEDWNY